MTYEDFDTYTKKGADSSKITTDGQSAFLDVHDISQEAYIIKDKGIDHFRTFSHHIAAMSRDYSEAASNWWPYVLTNTDSVAGDQYTNDRDGIGFMFNRSGGGSNIIYLCNFVDNTEVASTTGYTLNEYLYFDISRAYDILVVDIFNDSERTDLRESIYIECQTSYFRYYIALSTYGIGGGAAAACGYVKDVNLHETGCDTFLLAGDDITLEFNFPTDMTVENSRDTKQYHFFSGADNVSDVGKNAETVILNGYLASGVSVTFESLDEIVDNGEEVTISEFDIPNIDTTWYISDYNYTVEAGMPDRCKWSLTLER